MSGLLLYNQSRDYYPSKYAWLPYGYVGWVARATYGYADKYLVDFSAGYNGSENFAPGKTRYGLFPSGSLGWVVSEEKFMKKAKWIDFLKLRASIGLVGNDQGNSVRFMYMDGVWNDAGAYYFGTGKSDGVPRYELGTPGNKQYRSGLRPVQLPPALLRRYLQGAPHRHPDRPALPPGHHRHLPPEHEPRRGGQPGL